MKAKKISTPPSEIDIDLVLSGLDEILGGAPTSSCKLYYAEAGLMIEWRTRARILNSEILKSLMKLASRARGDLWVSPNLNEAMKNEAGVPVRVLDIAIRSGPVTVHWRPDIATLSAP